jgi:hypothetical protein
VSQQELLTSVSAALDSMGIEYMVTGSVASSFYGEPRLSHDIDVLLHVTAESAVRLAIVDTDSGDKVDFWILTSSPYDRERFRRRVRVDAFGAAVWVSSSEDVILSKLSWSMKAGGREKQFRDALRVFEVQEGRLDVAYCKQWAAALGVQELWDRLLAEAEP